MGSDEKTLRARVAEESGRLSRFLVRLLPIGVMVLALLVLATFPASGQECRPLLVERQRFGFVALASNWQQQFDAAQLRAGWYVDMGHLDPAIEGLDQALLIRVRPGFILDPSALGPLVDSHPGAIWLIGNEPDCIWQDAVLPTEYARIYHDLYTFIKSRDQTSQIAAGGIVQPTPLRLQYLNRVLAAYRERFGRPLPVDLWHIHNAILNEERGSWGADIPPGIDAQAGAIRSIDDNDNMTIFRAQIWAFRQWLADHGYAGYPLIVTEYGILMPDDYGFGVKRVNDFMSATFDFFQSASDPGLGDPSDGYRLVQRWAWFSLDDRPWNPITGEGFNGNLFDPDTESITAFGLNYAHHTSHFPPLNDVDLGFAAWQIVAPAPIAATETISHPVQVRVANVGTEDVGSFGVTLDYTGPASGRLDQAVTALPRASSQWLTFTLANLPPGAYDLALGIDPDDRVAETRECNNQASTSLIIPTDAVYLPLMVRYEPFTSSQTPRSYASPVQQSTEPFQRAPEAQGFREFQVPTAGGYPVQITLDNQGKVWVSEQRGNKIAQFDPHAGDGTWQEFEIPTDNSAPWGLAVDAAGNVWFAEMAANQIGKLDVTTSIIVEYPIPTVGSQPWELAIGDDGAVWFTEKAGNKIGKLEPSTGTITEYPVPTANAQPTGIALHGTDIWFTESAANKLGWMDARTGLASEFIVPTPNGNPQDVAVTSSGNPWLTERQGDKIALFRASTIQDMHEIPVAATSGEPFGIAVEGQRAVWFTEQAGNRLGRFTGGTIPPIEYSLPTPDSAPSGIAIDDAGCAWYTAPSTDRIGRLCLSRMHVPLAPWKFGD